MQRCGAVGVLGTVSRGSGNLHISTGSRAAYCRGSHVGLVLPQRSPFLAYNVGGSNPRKDPRPRVYIRTVKVLYSIIVQYRGEVGCNTIRYLRY